MKGIKTKMFANRKIKNQNVSSIRLNLWPPQMELA